MLKIDSILYPTDFSEHAEHALPYAIRFARLHGADLHMLHAVVLHADDPGNPEHHFPDDQEIERLSGDLIGAEERVSEADGGGELKIERAIQRDLSAAPAILDYATEHDIDLIVMGTHGRRGVRHLLMGSVAEEVVRLAACPVLTVRESEDEATAAQIKVIVVPTDFSEHAEMAVDYAKELAPSFGARLLLVHAVEEPTYPDFYMPALPLEAVEELKERAGERLRKTIAQVEGPGVEAGIEVRAGKPALEISEFAEAEDAGLIVMASHGLTGLRHLLLGSVTEQVIRRAPCPVLTVKAFGKRLL